MKKIVLLVLAVCLAASLLGGCGGRNTSIGQNQSAGSATPAQSESPAGKKTMVIGDTTFNSKNWEEWFYQCQNCNARVGCHRGTTRPLGNVANEVLQLKRMETHQVFDAFWKGRHMSRTAAYKWLSKKMGLPEEKTHIGGFEMDQCQQVIDICRQIETAARNTEAA